MTSPCYATGERSRKPGFGREARAPRRSAPDSVRIASPQGGPSLRDGVLDTRHDNSRRCPDDQAWPHRLSGVDVGWSAGLCSDLHICRFRGWSRYSQTFLLEAVDVELNRFLHIGFSLRLCPTRRHATRNIGGVCRKSGSSLLYNDEIFHYFSPACSRTLLSVPMASSSPRCPGTVTSPRFAECLNCRWLPRIRTWYQPSASSSRRTSLTFMGRAHLHYTPLHNDQAQPRTSRVAGWPSAGAPRYAALHCDRCETEHARLLCGRLDVTSAKSFPYIVETIRVFQRKIR